MFPAAPSNNTHTLPDTVTISVLGNNLFSNSSFWFKHFQPKIPRLCKLNQKQNNSILASSPMHRPTTVTDSTFILIFKENVPLFTIDIMYGLGSSGFLLTRFVILFVYAYMTYLEYFSHTFKIKVLQCLAKCGKFSSSQIRKSSLRHYKFISRRTLLERTLVVYIFLLLILCGDVHPNPGPRLPGSRRHPFRQMLNVASWNVRTLLDTNRTAIRPSAIVARELNRYSIDIAALSETRLLGENVIEEVAGGYTFFLIGKPLGERADYGVGFAIRTSLVKHLQGKYPIGINERLMTMTLPLVGGTLDIISAYAPTLKKSDEVKANFYGHLNDAINAVPSSHKLLVLGDFNARVGCDHSIPFSLQVGHSHIQIGIVAFKLE